ncbi:MAG TPA: response regulator [Gemmataceae bacterium]|jgi:DNA-binding NtrC family response regulator
MTETGKHAILLVDDEPEILFSLRGLLRRDFDVHTAESGAEAMEVLKQQPIHVILTDQRMPGMTGVQLLHRVQGEYPQAIRIVFTGYADIKAVIDAVNQGHIYRYITKPWDPDELMSVLRQACAAYDRLVEHQRLLADLRRYLAVCVPLLQGLPQPAEDAVELAVDGGALLRRLDRALAGQATNALVRES